VLVALGELLQVEQLPPSRDQIADASRWKPASSQASKR
jgi:hypothetical protein